MNPWTQYEEKKLSELVNGGQHTWAQIAAELPGRSRRACATKATNMRVRGHELAYQQRKLSVSFRLAADVKLAFEELCTATGEKPGALLQHALEYVLEKDKLFDVSLHSRKVNGDSLRVAACWSVPATLLDRVAEKIDGPRYAAAQHAVHELLTAYGFKIETEG